MTVAPPFFIIALLYCLGFLGISLVPAVILLWLGKRYRSIRILHPFRAIYLIAIFAFAAQAVIALPQVVAASVAPDIQTFIPPYLAFFFVVGLIVFNRRIECEKYGRKEFALSVSISAACVLWFWLAGWSLRTYIGAA